jgi:hypothetical protein
MRICNRSHCLRLTAATILMLAMAGPAEAGPPLLCDPFDAGSARVLPWSTSVASWNAPDPSYDVKRLVDDTLGLLTPDMPVLARMENMRRATIYATRDRDVARALLDAVIARTNATDANALAWFDAGYLIETYRQAAHVARYDMLNSQDQRRWTLTTEPRTDGYALVRKALAMSGTNAGMEFAAALMTTGETSQAHRRRALAAATPDSALALHVRRYR